MVRMITRQATSARSGPSGHGGIDSISVSPESFAEVKTHVAEAERELD
jgi:hypothetical protein